MRAQREGAHDIHQAVTQFEVFRDESELSRFNFREIQDVVNYVEQSGGGGSDGLKVIPLLGR